MVLYCAIAVIACNICGQNAEINSDYAREILNFAALPIAGKTGTQFDNAQVTVRRVPEFDATEFYFKTSVIVFNDTSKKLMFLRISDETRPILEEPLDPEQCKALVLNLCKEIRFPYDLNFNAPVLNRKKTAFAFEARIKYGIFEAGTLMAEVDPNTGAIVHFNTGNCFAPPHADPPTSSLAALQQSMVENLAFKHGIYDMELAELPGLELGNPAKSGFDVRATGVSKNYAAAVATRTNSYFAVSWIRDLSDGRIARVLQDPWTGNVLSVQRLRGNSGLETTNPHNIGSWRSIGSKAEIVIEGRRRRISGSTIESTTSPNHNKFTRRFIIVDGSRWRVFYYDKKSNRVRFGAGPGSVYGRPQGSLKSLLTES